mgnify:CR=1 FL=1
MKRSKSPKLMRRAAVLRNNPTKAERLLWSKLRQRKLGVKFRRQHLLGNFILDFYCPAVRIAIELDGACHAKTIESDRKRDEKLAHLGVQVLRFENQDVFTDMDSVLASIQKKLSESPKTSQTKLSDVSECPSAKHQPETEARE